MRRQSRYTRHIGNRSALEWIVSDPNRPDDEEYIVPLLGQVVRVRVETGWVVSKLCCRESSRSRKRARGRLNDPWARTWRSSLSPAYFFFFSRWLRADAAADFSSLVAFLLFRTFGSL